MKTKKTEHTADAHFCNCRDPITGLLCNRESNHPGQHCRFTHNDNEALSRHNYWWNQDTAALALAGKGEG